MSCSQRDRGRAPRPVLVEFIGTPGSGKTTLSLRLIEELRREGATAGSVVGTARDHAARTRLGRLVRLAPMPLRRPMLWWTFYLLATWHALVFALEHRTLVRDVIRMQYHRAIPGATKRHIVYWFVQLGGRYRFLRTTSRPGEVIVFDDGFLHRAVHLHASYAESPDVGQLAAYLERIPRPDVVVHASAACDVCEQRVVARGVWAHSRSLTQEQLGRYLVAADAVTRRAARHARERAWTVVDVATDGEPGDVEEALAEAVATVARTARIGEGVCAA
jgi:nucleoside-triphosphatase THEP1